MTELQKLVDVSALQVPLFDQLSFGGGMQCLQPRIGLYQIGRWAQNCHPGGALQGVAAGNMLRLMSTWVVTFPFSVPGCGQILLNCFVRQVDISHAFTVVHSGRNLVATGEDVKSVWGFFRRKGEWVQGKKRANCAGSLEQGLDPDQVIKNKHEKR